MNNDTQDFREALVVKSTGSWYVLWDICSGERIEARLSGRIRLQGRRSTNPVVVGDRVEYRFENFGKPLDSETGTDRPWSKKRAPVCNAGSGADPMSDAEISADKGEMAMTGVITRICDRRNYIIRRSSNLSRESHIIAANIDQAFLVVTLAFPETNFEFIDRFLVTAEAYHIPTVIVLNKIDLYNTPEMKEKQVHFREIYTSAGYEVMELAASLGEGVTLLRDRLQGKISLLSGNSGVGKSTLIRAIDPSLTPRVGAISEYHHRGRHTTTFSEMYPLQGGGWLIDTPGIKGFGLIDLSGEEVGRYFPDLFRYAPRCTYYNCTHTHEPGCAVKEAVQRGEVSSSRYISYLKLLEEDEKYRK